MKTVIRTHLDLEVYTKAFRAAMELFEASKGFPAEERYSLTDQVRRSSRSVCANIAEGWRRRRYPKSFVNCLRRADAAETQVWLQFAVECRLLDPETGRTLYRTYDEIQATLVGMMTHTSTWCLPEPSATGDQPTE